MIGNGRKLTGRQKLDIEERKRELIDAAGARCVVAGCCGPLELAHRLGQGKGMMRKYGPAIIHHALAVVPTCSRHNASVLIGDETVPGRALVARIRAILAGDEPEPDIREEYRNMQEEFMEKLAHRF